MRRESGKEGRQIKPYFFGHIDKTKGFYNEERKKYMKHDTSMDYLREILEGYKPPMSEKKTASITSILDKTYLDNSKEYKQIINRIMYMIEQFKKSSYFIWNGYVEVSNKYQIYIEEETKLIDSINQCKINNATLYRLVYRLDKTEFSDFVMKILFNIGNETALDLIKQSQETVSTLVEDESGEISLYGFRFKKSQKMG